MPNRLHVLVKIIIIIIIIIIISIIIIIVIYSSGLDTDEEKLYTIFIVNVFSLKVPPTLIHTKYLC